jgi:dTDP-glucose 4,6-dehydratase
MRVLVTGGAGFIGSNFVRRLVASGCESVVVVDALTYAGTQKNLADIPSSALSFFRINICDSAALATVFADHDIQQVVHFAAESHVDRSIASADPFTMTNVVGTQRLLDVCRKAGIERFIHVSTDEVYGSLQPHDAPFTESSPLQPNSPYAASKAASDLMVRSYHQTFDFPAIITRCSNNYGPYQFPEKLIPLMIYNATHNKPLPIYGDGQNIRDWVHVHDHCDALLRVLTHGQLGECYNIGGTCEQTNQSVVTTILDTLGVSHDHITYVADRLGHDFRYAISHDKITTQLGWFPKIPFAHGIMETIQWYTDHTEWLEHVMASNKAVAQ